MWQAWLQERCRFPSGKIMYWMLQKNAMSSSFKRKVHSGNSSAKGVIGNSGNSSAKGVIGNSGNTTSGKKKTLAGKRSALRRSTKMLLVVKNPWLDLILSGK